MKNALEDVKTAIAISAEGVKIGRQEEAARWNELVQQVAKLAQSRGQCGLADRLYDGARELMENLE